MSTIGSVTVQTCADWGGRADRRTGELSNLRTFCIFYESDESKNEGSTENDTAEGLHEEGACSVMEVEWYSSRSRSV